MAASRSCASFSYRTNVLIARWRLEQVRRVEARIVSEQFLERLAAFQGQVLVAGQQRVLLPMPL